MVALSRYATASHDVCWGIVRLPTDVARDSAAMANERFQMGTAVPVRGLADQGPYRRSESIWTMAITIKASGFPEARNFLTQQDMVPLTDISI